MRENMCNEQAQHIGTVVEYGMNVMTKKQPSMASIDKGAGIM
jgi:hypothetical protein